ncbi:hypothetical protein HG530_014305 [Fusarium avenaceum]|nr:hypothetical protein HG530_014305 [Fusarium avenaceum]
MCVSSLVTIGCQDWSDNSNIDLDMMCSGTREHSCSWPESLLCFQNSLPLPLDPFEQFLLNVLTLLFNHLRYSIIDNPSKIIDKVDKLLASPIVNELLSHGSAIRIVNTIISFGQLCLSPGPSIQVTLLGAPVYHRCFKPWEHIFLIRSYRSVESFPTSKPLKLDARINTAIGTSFEVDVDAVVSSRFDEELLLSAYIDKSCDDPI